MDLNSAQNQRTTQFQMDAKSQKRWLSKSPRSPFVLCIGITGSGKTQLLEKMKNIENLNTPGGGNAQNESQNSNPRPTIGVEYFHLSHPNRNNKSLLVKEVGGSMKSIWEKYYTNSNGIIFTLDMSNTLSLAPALIEFQRLIQSETATGKPTALVLTKVDSPYTLSIEELDWLMKCILGHSLKKLESRLSVFFTSAVQNRNLKTLRQWIAKTLTAF